MRVLKSSNEFFELMDQIGNGKFVTIGYVTGANLNVPKVKRKNPATNRMKGYPDYSAFVDDSGEEVGAVVKIKSYNMRYLNRNTVGKMYDKWKSDVDAIRGEYGLGPMGSTSGYKKSTNWSPNGPEMYDGKNEALRSHSYNPQNRFGVKPKSVTYAVNRDGHIIRELSDAELKPFLGARKEVGGVKALREMGVEEERIKEFINRINDLKFSYINFESNSILWVAATVNGEKIIYINDNFNRAVDDININPDEFIAIARERYKEDLAELQESYRRRTNKKVVRLTESDLRGIVRSVVLECINGRRKLF